MVAGSETWAPAAVLCIGDDGAGLRADLSASAMAVGTSVAAPDGAPALDAWSSARLVLVHPTATLLLGHLPRRPGVVLVRSAQRVGTTAAEPDEHLWRRAVEVGAEHVVELPAGWAWLRERLRAAGRRRGLCVATVGACGGAGSTTTAVALATAAATRGARVALIDMDVLGGGIDLALGAETLPGLRWHDLRDVRAPLPTGGLVAALPRADGVAVLSHGRDVDPPEPEAVGAVVEAALGEHDVVVVDLPRLPEPSCAAVLPHLDEVVLVCPATIRAGAAAPAVLRRWAFGPAVHLLVHGPSPAGVAVADVENAIRAGLLPGPDLPCVRAPDDAPAGSVRWIRAEPGLAAALDRGEPFAVGARSPLRRWAAGWLAGRVGRSGPVPSTSDRRAVAAAAG